MHSPTEILSDFAANLDYDSLPPETIAKAKICILDSIGCSVGGAHLDPGKIVNDVMNTGGRPDAVVLGGGPSAPALTATYINAFCANVMDFDDSFLGHPGATIIHPAIAFGQRENASGERLLLSVILGYEILGRVGRAIQPSRARYRQVRGFNTYHTFGAMAATGKILNLDAEGFSTAFGLAGTSAPVPSLTKLGYGDGPLSWLKNNFGWTAMGGALGAELAARSFVGNRHFLDGDDGFWRMAGSDRCDFETMTSNLGADFQILNVALKPYSSCRFTHSAIYAVKAILDRELLSPTDIDEVIVESFGRLGDLMDYEPTNVTDAQFSLPYVVASTLLGIPTGWQWFSEQNWQRSQLVDLMNRVKFQLDQDIDRRFFAERRYAARVTIRTVEGSSYTNEVASPPGEPNQPLSAREVEIKFRDNVEPTLGTGVTDGLIHWVNTIEEQDDISLQLKCVFDTPR